MRDFFRSLLTLRSFGIPGAGCSNNGPDFSRPLGQNFVDGDEMPTLTTR